MKEKVNELLQNKKVFYGGLAVISSAVLLFIYKGEIRDFLNSFLPQQNQHQSEVHKSEVHKTYHKTTEKKTFHTAKAEQRAVQKRTYTVKPITPKREMERETVKQRQRNIPPITVNEDRIVEKVIERLLNDKNLQERFFKVILGLKDISDYAIDVSKFEARKQVLERDIELLKLLIKKQKLQREYAQLLAPPQEKENQKILALEKQIAQLQKQIASMKTSTKTEAESKKETQKQESIVLKPATTPEDLFKKYSNFFTSVVKIGEKTYLLDKNGNYYPVGSILPDGTKIVDATLTSVKLKKDNVEVSIPIGMIKENSSKKNLPF